jgi:hypothetical protein
MNGRRSAEALARLSDLDRRLTVLERRSRDSW